MIQIRGADQREVLLIGNGEEDPVVHVLEKVGLVVGELAPDDDMAAAHQPYLVGAFGFNVLAQQSSVPVIALGGMDAQRAAELGWPRWGAIDGLASTKVA